MLTRLFKTYINKTTLFSVCSILFISACNQDPGQSLPKPQGQDQLTRQPIPITTTSDGSTSENSSSNPTPTSSPTSTPSPQPSPSPTGSPTPQTPTTVGSSCHSSNSDQMCLGLNYAVYMNSSGQPVVTEAEAIDNVTKINEVWSKCKIAFQIDELTLVNPSDEGLIFNTSDYSELNDIRSKLDDSAHILVVTTGSWDRNGSLGSTGANAWTNLPGEGVYGAILEAPVGTYSNIIAHELGHYLNLDHASDSSNLMNPTIYDSSTQLYSSQCTEARAAISAYWQAMLR